MHVVEFLQGQVGKDGHCSTDAADWCMACGYPDFAAKWRGWEDTEGVEPLLPLWGEGIGDGLPEVKGEVQAGDIAVITALSLEAGAIFTGQRWAIRSGKGMSYITPNRVTVIKAWRP